MRRPYVPYYEPPDGTQVREYDEVEVTSGPYKGVVGTVSTIDPDGDIKLWVEQSVQLDGKLWLHKPTLRCRQRLSIEDEEAMQRRVKQRLDKKDDR